jgi:hypothetical protein
LGTIKLGAMVVLFAGHNSACYFRNYIVYSREGHFYSDKKQEGTGAYVRTCALAHMRTNKISTKPDIKHKINKKTGTSSVFLKVFMSTRFTPTRSKKSQP